MLCSLIISLADVEQLAIQYWTLVYTEDNDDGNENKNFLSLICFIFFNAINSPTGRIELWFQEVDSGRGCERRNLYI